MLAPALTLLLVLVQVAGSPFIYEVRKGDSLTSVGARFGVERAVLAEDNQLKPSALLQTGQTLQIDNRHIVPADAGATIVVNVPQRMLFLFDDGRLLGHFPISVGSAGWKTPLGQFSIAIVEEDPTWDVPVSIQEEMRSQGKTVVTRVLPGPSNPLGKYWIGLSIGGVGIHGTNAPQSIFQTVTHGCIRLHPEDVEYVVTKVATGDPVHVIYEPVLLARKEDSVFLEVHRYVYKQNVNPLEKARKLAQEMGVEEMIDWKKAEQAARKREGVARNVTMLAPLNAAMQ
jgi:L,D-transpeptidase ErfK/SrfK